MKNLKKLGLLLLGTALVFGFAGCSNSADDGFAVAGTPADNTTKTSADAPAENTPKTPAQTKSFTVTFNTNGGSTVEKQTVKEGEKATKPADPTKANDEDYKDYTFAGWFKDSALTSAFDFENAITADITLYAKWTGTAIIYIGSKKPSVAKEVGDIVFSDGSSMTYSDFSALDDTVKAEKKTSAIALIFYRGTELNSDVYGGTNEYGDVIWTSGDANTVRTLGVGLKHAGSGYGWCKNEGDNNKANAFSLNIKTIQCSSSGDAGELTFTGDKNGSDNLEQIAAFLTTANGVTDDTATAENYPAFYYAKNYKEKKVGDEATSRVAGTAYEDGWYLPSLAELFQIWKNKTTINIAIEALGGSKLTDGDYLSSSQFLDEEGTSPYGAYCLNFSNGNRGHYRKDNNNFPVCAIRAF